MFVDRHRKSETLMMYSHVRRRYSASASFIYKPEYSMTWAEGRCSLRPIVDGSCFLHS